MAHSMRQPPPAGQHLARPSKVRIRRNLLSSESGRIVVSWRSVYGESERPLLRLIAQAMFHARGNDEALPGAQNLALASDLGHDFAFEDQDRLIAVRMGVEIVARGL